MKGADVTIAGIVFILALLAPAPAFAGEPGDGREDDGGEIALTREDIPARIAQADVGEWALYRLADGGQSRLTVVEKWEDHGETYLVIQNEIIKPRRKRGRVTEERICVGDAVRDLRNLTSEDRVTRSDVLVHGRRLRTVVVHFVENGKVVRQSYFSDRIPVYGLVRGVNATAKDKEALTLVDYGFPDESD